MSDNIFTTIKNDLDNYWYPRILGVYAREEPFVVTDVDLDRTPAGDDIVMFHGLFVNETIRREVGIYPEDFTLEPSGRCGSKTYRIAKIDKGPEIIKMSDAIKRWGELSASGEKFEISINIDGNETFHAHDYYWDGSSDWVVLKGHNDIRDEHFMYIPGTTEAKVYDNDGVYVVDFDQIFTH